MFPLRPGQWLLDFENPLLGLDTPPLRHHRPPLGKTPPSSIFKYRSSAWPETALVFQTADSQQFTTKINAPMKKTKNTPSETHSNFWHFQIGEETRTILKLWRANREFRMRDTKFEDYQKVGAEYACLFEKIDARNRELTKMRKERDKLAAKLVVLNARARSGMRGYFGLKSPEFAQIKTTKPHKTARPPQKPAAAKSELPAKPDASPAS